MFTNISDVSKIGFESDLGCNETKNWLRTFINTNQPLQRNAQRWTDGQTDGQTDGWIDQTHSFTHQFPILTFNMAQFAYPIVKQFAGPSM